MCAYDLLKQILMQPNERSLNSINLTIALLSDVRCTSDVRHMEVSDVRRFSDVRHLLLQGVLNEYRDFAKTSDVRPVSDVRHFGCPKPFGRPSPHLALGFLSIQRGCKIIGRQSCFGRPTLRTSETLRMSDFSHMLFFTWVTEGLQYGQTSVGFRTSEVSDVRTPSDVRQLLSCQLSCAALCGLSDVRTSSDVRQLETSDVRTPSDVRHLPHLLLQRTSVGLDYKYPLTSTYEG